MKCQLFFTWHWHSKVLVLKWSDAHCVATWWPNGKHFRALHIFPDWKKIWTNFFSTLFYLFEEYLASERTHWAFGKKFRKTNIPHVGYWHNIKSIYHCEHIILTVVYWFYVMPITHMWVIENSITHMWDIENSIYHMWDIGFLELSCMTSLWYNNVNVALVTRRYWDNIALVTRRYWKINQRVVTNKAQVAKIKPQVREAHEWFYLPRVLYWSPQVDIFSIVVL